MISITTPCNRIIPWYNARLINVCSQSFKDWEWVILDNSSDGRVKRYIDNFFENMQGVHYPECRDKIKCYHESFDGLGYKDGRMGVIRNRTIELTTCGDDDFILVLDSDDFIHDGFLEDIHDIQMKYPECEIIQGMVNEEYGQDIDSGLFYKHNIDNVWNSMDTARYNKSIQLDVISSHGVEWKNLNAYREFVLNMDCRNNKVENISSKLKIPYVNMVFEFDRITRLTDNMFTFISSCTHPMVYRKKAFLEKVGGYNTLYSREDCVTFQMEYKLDNMVYINKPCYVEIIVTKGGYRDSATIDVCSNIDKDKDSEFFFKNAEVKYLMLKDCMATIKPIFYNEEHA